MESLVVVAFNQALESARDGLLIQRELVLREGGNLLQHGGDVVDALEQLNIDLEVEGNLSFLFFSLKLNSLVLRT